MERITRPKTALEVSIMLHLAEFMLTQVQKVLGNVMIAPDKATNKTMIDRVNKASRNVEEALTHLFFKY
jgi:hypothetical protein